MILPEAMPRLAKISGEEALELYRRSSIHDLAKRADEITQNIHPGNARTYVIERNINYTNICVTRCRFCAFSRTPKDSGGYVLDRDALFEKIRELTEIGGTQILLQGGMNPSLGPEWYEELLRSIKERFPSLHIHAFSPAELWYIHTRFGISPAELLERLMHAGLGSLPGGGAEILADRVRKRIAPAKCSAGEWAEVCRQAHAAGLCTTATMMFGHVESDEERIAHLGVIRDLQEEAMARRRKNPRGGYITAFTCWPFQPGNTLLANEAEANDSGSNPVLRMAGAYDVLKLTALARIFLANVPNLQTSWVTQGPAAAQLCLRAGCNDMGSLMMEENVVSAAGTSYRLHLEALRELIRQAGFTPVQRDFYYNPVPESRKTPMSFREDL